MPAHYRAWCKALEPYGVPFSESRFYSLGGVPTLRICQILFEEAGKAAVDFEALSHSKEQLFLDTFEDNIQENPPVVAIARAHRGRLPMAVASGGLRDIVQRTLKHLRIDGWFDAVVAAEDTERHKPEPDVFLEAARRLGVAANLCTVYEDTDLGLEAARRAGMAWVDVRTLAQTD